jgi:hypothetical protein
VGRRSRARQQPHEDCSADRGSIIAQTKSRLTTSPQSLVSGGKKLCFIAAIAAVHRILCEFAGKLRVKMPGRSRLSCPVYPDFIEELARLNKNQAFRDRN